MKILSHCFPFNISKKCHIPLLICAFVSLYKDPCYGVKCKSFFKITFFKPVQHYSSYNFKLFLIYFTFQISMSTSLTSVDDNVLLDSGMMWSGWLMPTFQRHVLSLSLMLR